jgi:hypothetical protein
VIAHISTRRDVAVALFIFGAVLLAIGALRLATTANAPTIGPEPPPATGQRVPEGRP